MVEKTVSLSVKCQTKNIVRRKFTLQPEFAHILKVMGLLKANVLGKKKKCQVLVPYQQEWNNILSNNEATTC